MANAAPARESKCVDCGFVKTSPWTTPCPVYHSGLHRWTRLELRAPKDRKDGAVTLTPTDEQQRALVALLHLQEAIRNGAAWDESHYSAVNEIAGFIGGDRG